MTILEESITRSTKKLQPRTRELYLQHVRAFLALVGARREDWTASNVEAWRSDMRRRKILPQSVNVAINALRFAARRAGLKFVDQIETLPVRRTEFDKAADRPLKWREGKRLIQACDSESQVIRDGEQVVRDGDNARNLRDRAIIILGLRTGMLRFSMCHLKLDDLTRTARSAPSLTFVRKGGEKHTIRLDPLTADVICAWVEWLEGQGITDGYLFRSLGRVRRDDGVTAGDQLTPDGLYRALRERARRVGLHDLSPHVFHKTFIAWAREAGAKSSQIVAVTGHKSDGFGDEDEDDQVGEPANFLIADPLQHDSPKLPKQRITARRKK